VTVGSARRATIPLKYKAVEAEAARWSPETNAALEWGAGQILAQATQVEKHQPERKVRDSVVPADFGISMKQVGRFAWRRSNTGSAAM
jgi:hypothetical protein